MTAFVRPAHPLLGRGAAGWQEVFGYPLALTTVAHDHLDWMRDARSKHEGRAGLINCNSVRMLRQIVATTDAIGFEPRRILALPFERGEFVELPVDQDLGALHPAIVWREDRALGDDARMLVDLLLRSDRGNSR